MFDLHLWYILMKQDSAELFRLYDKVLSQQKLCTQTKVLILDFLLCPQCNSVVCYCWHLQRFNIVLQTARVYVVQDEAKDDDNLNDSLAPL